MLPFVLHRRRYILLALALAAALLLFIDGLPIRPRRSYFAIWNSGHFWLYAAASYLGSHLLLQRTTIAWRYIWPSTLILALISGIGIEYTQSLIKYRDPSIDDIYADIAGNLFASCYIGVRHTTIGTIKKSSLIALAITLTLYFNKSSYLAVCDEIIAAKQFPALITANSADELNRLSRPKAHRFIPASPGLPASIEITLSRKYNGFKLQHFIGQWQDYQTLEITLENHQQPLPISCTIYDNKHTHQHSDRYTLNTTLPSGVTTLRLDLLLAKIAPLTRTMNLNNITALICYSDSISNSHPLRLLSIQLTNKGSAPATP